MAYKQSRNLCSNSYDPRSHQDQQTAAEGETFKDKKLLRIVGAKDGNCEMSHLLEESRLNAPFLHMFLRGRPKTGCEVFILSTKSHVPVNAACVR